MDLLQSIAAKAQGANSHIVLAEGDDPRVAKAAIRAVENKIARISVIADPVNFADLTGGHGAAKNIEVLQTSKSPKLEEYSNSYFNLRKKKGINESRAREAVLQNINFAAMMVRHGHAGGTIAGAVNTTADTIRAALQIVGKSENSKIVSSYFLMILPPPHSRPVVFADCALVASPTPVELADIAISSAQSFQQFTGEKPRVAMLSFSTKGSATHGTIAKVREAVDLAKDRAPNLSIDGEIQFDAAIDMTIQKKKAPDSKLDGEANVFIFPDLNSGNIGYKIAQRIGGAVALGPVLQGLAKPANDLSRGCSMEDVYQMISITAAQTFEN